MTFGRSGDSMGVFGLFGLWFECDFFQRRDEVKLVNVMIISACVVTIIVVNIIVIVCIVTKFVFVQARWAEGSKVR